MSDDNMEMTSESRASSRDTSHLTPPVMPAEMVEEYAEGVLFSDPELTVWWWNTHDFLTNQQRLQMAQKILPLCTSRPCKFMFQQVIAELATYLGPVSSGDALANGVRNLIVERPYFSAVIGLAFGYLVIAAGSNLFETVMRLVGAK